MSHEFQLRLPELKLVGVQCMPISVHILTNASANLSCDEVASANVGLAIEKVGLFPRHFIMLASSVDRDLNVGPVG